jgi:hypothetical protein
MLNLCLSILPNGNQAHVVPLRKDEVFQSLISHLKCDLPGIDCNMHVDMHGRALPVCLMSPGKHSLCADLHCSLW